MNTIFRNKDIITQNEDLETLHTYKNLPVFIGVVDQPISEDVFEDMRWQISKSSGMIQLNPLIPMEILYKSGHGSGTVGKLWKSHHDEFSKFIRENSHPKNVFEIGGYHGILAKIYRETYSNIDNNLSWTIIDPNPCVLETLPVKVIKNFFNGEFKSNQKYDTIIHSHLLEHMYNPIEFLNHVSSFVDEDSFIIFSVPNMKNMLEKKYINCLNFEHTVFITEPYIDFLLSNCGFSIVKKSYFMDDHSIFYCTKKTKNKTDIFLPHDLYEVNKRIFMDYVKYYSDYIQYLNEIIKTIQSPVYLFGAHIFSQFLISNGLDTSKIVSILDNDSQKQNKRLYGSNLRIESPITLKNVRDAAIILKAGHYNEEIKQDIHKNINKNIRFL